MQIVLQAHYKDNRSIQGFNLFKDKLHLLESEKRLITKSLITKFDNIVLVLDRSNKFAKQKDYILTLIK